MRSPFGVNGPNALTTGRQSKRALQRLRQHVAGREPVEQVGLREHRRRCLAAATARLLDDQRRAARAAGRCRRASPGRPASSVVDGRELGDDVGDRPAVEQRRDRARRLVEQLVEQRARGAGLRHGVCVGQLLQALEPGDDLLDLVQRLADELRQLVELVEADVVEDVAEREDAEELGAGERAEPGVGIERACRGELRVPRDRPGHAREAAQLQVGRDEAAGAVALGAERHPELRTPPGRPARNTWPGVLVRAPAKAWTR